MHFCSHRINLESSHLGANYKEYTQSRYKTKSGFDCRNYRFCSQCKNLTSEAMVWGHPAGSNEDLLEEPLLPHHLVSSALVWFIDSYLAGYISITPLE